MAFGLAPVVVSAAVVSLGVLGAALVTAVLAEGVAQVRVLLEDRACGELLEGRGQLGVELAGCRAEALGVESIFLLGEGEPTDAGGDDDIRVSATYHGGGGTRPDCKAPIDDRVVQPLCEGGGGRIKDPYSPVMTPLEQLILTMYNLEKNLMGTVHHQVDSVLNNNSGLLLPFSHK